MDECFWCNHPEDAHDEFGCRVEGRWQIGLCNCEGFEREDGS